MIATKDNILELSPMTEVDDRRHELMMDVQSALRAGSYASGLRNVQVGLREDAVALSGRVGSYYLKQMAQHLAKLEIECTELVNEIEVDAMAFRGPRR